MAQYKTVRWKLRINIPIIELKLEKRQRKIAGERLNISTRKLQQESKPVNEELP